jgi:hypothetical protein
MAEVSVELTYAEIHVLTRELGLGMPVGIAADDLELPEPVAARLAERARAALIVRRVVSVAGEVNHAVQALLDLAASPSLAFAVEINSDGIVESHLLLNDPDLGVQISPIAPSVFRLTPYVTRDAIRRIIQLTNLQAVEAPAVSPIQLTVAQISQATTLAQTDMATAISYIGSIGVIADARVLAAALAHRRRTVSVTALHRPDDQMVEGGVLSWIDCGAKGNWHAETPIAIGSPVNDDHHDMVMLTPRTAKDLVAEMIGYLPAAFSSFDSPR